MHRVVAVIRREKERDEKLFSFKLLLDLPIYENACDLPVLPDRLRKKRFLDFTENQGIERTDGCSRIQEPSAIEQQQQKER